MAASAGTLTATNVLPGLSSGSTGATGTFTQNGGTANITTLTLGVRTSGTVSATYNLAGGTLKSATIQAGTGTTNATRSFNWTDGIIQNLNSNTNLTTGTGITWTLISGTGSKSFTADSARTIAVNSTLSGTSGFSKDGLGTLTLTASNTYSGSTTINSGALVIGNGGNGSIGNSAVTVVAGTLTGYLASGNNIGTTGTPLTIIGDSTGSADAIITGGDGSANSIGRLATSGALTFNSDANFVFDLNSTATATADQVLVAGLTTINSSALFTFNAVGDGSGLTLNQTFTAIGGAGLISGTFSNLAPNGTINSNGVQLTANDYKRQVISS